MSPRAGLRGGGGWGVGSREKLRLEDATPLTPPCLWDETRGSGRGGRLAEPGRRTVPLPSAPALRSALGHAGPAVCLPVVSFWF